MRRRVPATARDGTPIGYRLAWLLALAWLPWWLGLPLLLGIAATLAIASERLGTRAADLRDALRWGLPGVLFAVQRGFGGTVLAWGVALLGALAGFTLLAGLEAWLDRNQRRTAIPADAPAQRDWPEMAFASLRPSAAIIELTWPDWIEFDRARSVGDHAVLDQRELEHGRTCQTPHDQVRADDGMRVQRNEASGEHDRQAHDQIEPAQTGPAQTPHVQAGPAQTGHAQVSDGQIVDPHGGVLRWQFDDERGGSLECADGTHIGQVQPRVSFSPYGRWLAALGTAPRSVVLFDHDTSRCHRLHGWQLCGWHHEQPWLQRGDQATPVPLHDISDKYRDGTSQR